MHAKLTGKDIPQADRLERVAARVRSLVLDDGQWSELDGRDAAYYTRAAQILGWLDEAGEATAVGEAVARADSAAEAMAHAVAAFEASAVGSAWLRHACFRRVEQLDPTSAAAFLEASTELSQSTAARRAGTLRRWQADLALTVVEEPTAVAHCRAFYAGEELAPHVVAFLRRPVDMSVPTRMANWAARQQIETFGQLMRWLPVDLLAEKNLGKKSIRLTSAVIADATGMTWEDVHGLLDDASVDVSALPASGADTETSPPLGTWAGCRAACPEQLREMSVTRLDLPTRMRTFFGRESVTTLGELLAWTAADLRDQKGVGRGTVRQTLATVRGFIERAAEEGPEAVARPSLDDLPDLFTLLKRELAELQAIERLVVTRRAGLHGEVPTLQELGDTLGVSRERVRQLEARATKRLSERWWAEQARARVVGSLRDGALGLEELARDPFFSEVDEQAVAFDFFLHRVLGEVARVVDIAGTVVVSTASQSSIDEALREMLRAARGLVFPVALDLVQRLAVRSAETLAPGLVPFFEHALHEELAIATAADGSQSVSGVGQTRGNRVLAFLEAAPEPVSIHQVEAAMGRGGLPDRVIYVARGIVGLPKHVPDFHLWSRRLVPLCVAVMSADDPGRQWSVSELLDEVAEQAQVPEWFGHWHLASMLRLSGKVRYLGRLQVALDNEAAPEERTYARDIVRDILRAEGAPRTFAQIEPLAQAKRGLNGNFLRLMLLQAPFVRVDADRFGLIDRDLPGGAEAIAEATETLEEELEARQRGLGPVAALALVRGLSDAHQRWSIDMLKTVVRQVGSFRLNRSGGVGLADWDDERLPTRRDAVAALVEDGDGRASVDAIIEAIEARFSTRSSRASLANLVGSLGFRLQGPDVVRDDIVQASVPPPPAELPDPATLPRFPLVARPLFQELLTEAIGDFAALRQESQDYVAEFDRAHEQNEFIDPDEARALAKASALLIDGLAADASAPTRQLIWAAVRYFVISEDADSDFAIGGLDDDIGVMNSIALYLERPECRVELT